jgi:hypothetical protein
MKYAGVMVSLSDGMIYVQTKFHEDWFMHSGNIKVITFAICEAAVLALLMGRIYDVCC